MVDENDSNNEKTDEIEIESIDGVENQADSKNASDETSARIKELETALAKAKNDHLYLMADFDNYKKRTIKERSDLMKYAGERAFVEIVNALDSFELALKADLTAGNLETFKKGFELIFQEMVSVLERFGVKGQPCEGLAFDPMVHEALGSEETDKAKAGTIFRVLRRPYKIHDKLLRPGQVIIAKEKDSSAQS